MTSSMMAKDQRENNRSQDNSNHLQNAENILFDVDNLIPGLPKGKNFRVNNRSSITFDLYLIIDDNKELEGRYNKLLELVKVQVYKDDSLIFEGDASGSKKIGEGAHQKKTSSLLNKVSDKIKKNTNEDIDENAIFLGKFNPKDVENLRLEFILDEGVDKEEFNQVCSKTEWTFKTVDYESGKTTTVVTGDGNKEKSDNTHKDSLLGRVITGDNSPILLMVVGIICCSLCAVLVLRKKNKEKKGGCHNE